MSDEKSSIILKYRPKTFDEVIGHEVEIKSIKNLLKTGKSRNFLLIGPSGIGKTTIARIIAKEVGAEKQNILEIDAATHSKVESMRDITSSLAYHSIGKNPVRVIIIDECHALSKASWQALLTSIEEPNTDTFWILCTTEGDKVPDTIKTRCSTFYLKPVDDESIKLLLQAIAELENFTVTENVIDLIVRESFGSPRRALQYLAACAFCTDRNEAANLINAADEQTETGIELCRLLVKRQGLNWQRVISILKEMRNTDPESVRIMIRRYVAKALMNTTSEDKVCWYLFIMECLNDRLPQEEKLPALLLQLGKIVFYENTQE